MSNYKKTHHCIIVFLLVTVTLLLFSCGDSASQPEKTLSVQKLGFDLSVNEAIIPGKTVRVFARANQSNGVTYEWNLPGSWISVKDNLVEWTVPSEEGDYSISVRVKNEAGETADSTASIKVYDQSAYTAPQACSFTVTSSTDFTNKTMKGLTNTFSSRILKYSDGTVTTITNMEGETKTSTLKGDEITQYKADGTKGDVYKGTNLANGFDATVFTLENFKTVIPAYTLANDTYSFSKSLGSTQLDVKFDAKTGRLKSLSKADTETDDSMTYEIAYQMVDGYLFPSEISVITIYYIGGVKNTSVMKQVVSDINIGEPEMEVE
jgi:hypothetical protein